MADAHNSLAITNLKSTVEETEILHGIDLTIKPGEMHAIMGPNGSGKSTLAYTLAGHPEYEVTDGSVTLDGAEILEMAPDERAQAGLFLAFQYPVEIPGVSVQNFLRHAHQARFEHQPDKQIAKALDFRKHLQALAEEFKVKPELLKRGLNEGFSGGEKKRLEILQMAVLEPRFAILDETDSGLDIDAIKIVAEGVNRIVEKFNTGIMVITHYKRILEYLNPTHVHVMVEGQIRQSGDAGLVDQLEDMGYSEFQ